MLIPIGDDNVEGGAKPIVTYAMLLLNSLIFFYEINLDSHSLQEFLNQYGTIPVDAARASNLHTLLTSMFLHGGWSHLIGNMLFLWIFGDNVEAIMGNVKFLVFYIGGGVLASLTHVWMNAESVIPSLGASGAISAILGAYIIMFPRSQVKMIFLLFFVTFYISSLIFIGFWFFQQFMSVYNETGLNAQSQGVAWWAHIGGFVFGVVCGFFFRSRAREYNFITDQRPIRTGARRYR